MAFNLAIAEVSELDSAELDSAEMDQQEQESQEQEAGESLPPAEESSGPAENGQAAEAGEVSPGSEESPPISEESPQVVVAEETAASLPTDPPDLTPAEILELRQQLARLQTVVEELRYGDDEIVRQAARVRALADEVQSLDSASKEAKAELTAAKERLESANRELRSMIGDRASGQRRLKLSVPAATGEKSADSAAAGQGQSVVSQVLAATADRINAGELNTGELTVTATVGGSDDYQPSASTGPAGSIVSAALDEHASSLISVLSQKQMLATFGQDEFEAAKNREEPFGLAKGEMEKLEAAEIQTIGDLEKMMREDAYWHQKMKGMGEKKIAKVIESLRVWRGKFPMPG